MAELGYFAVGNPLSYLFNIPPFDGHMFGVASGVQVLIFALASKRLLRTKRLVKGLRASDFYPRIPPTFCVTPIIYHVIAFSRLGWGKHVCFSKPARVVRASTAVFLTC